ncbi:hypothetical protein [Craterilacuibacter sinensis]|uniref:Uncharacterized protein n=1 Tax=Craterilacuibacter sinensis TaxID=2686017 RepID=A0A845BR82_9NEIS|nr:hypothetical protein [Craterilacuibacter sinensis]MXR36736.1 hypothetical protein [Craterilacuibacter sinensis]
MAATRLIDKVRIAARPLPEFSTRALSEALPELCYRQISSSLSYLAKLGEIKVIRKVSARASQGEHLIYAKTSAFARTYSKSGRPSPADGQRISNLSGSELDRIIARMVRANMEQTKQHGRLA